MFDGCSSLKELNLNNFNANNATNVRWMFYGCAEILKFKIKTQFKYFKNDAYY